MSQISRIAVKHLSPAELDDVVKKYEKYDGGIDPQHMKQLVEGLAINGINAHHFVLVAVMTAAMGWKPERMGKTSHPTLVEK